MLHRRQLLQAGCSSFLGLSLPVALQSRVEAASEAARARSVVIVFLTGGGSHIDMFDPKPDSPETKGEFDPIPTKIPGAHFGELMGGMAARADKLAIVRSMSHGDNRHLSGTHNTLSGSVQPFRGDSNQAKSLNRADWPCYGATLEYLRPRGDGLPSQVTLPNPLIEGTLVWPAQHAGFLGPNYDPMQLNGDPNAKDFKVNDLQLLEGVTAARFQDRWRLLTSARQREAALNNSPSGKKLTSTQDAAFSMLTSTRLANAFKIHDEPDAVRDRYGRDKLGQSMLLARRLVEAEVPVIQCNMGIVQSWDTHVDHFPRCRSKLLPPTDRGVSALIDDLIDRGLFDQTLILVVGEFGRTPKIYPLPNQKVPGRHHWAAGYTAVFAGAGVRGGQVIGASDKIGGRPTTRPYHPNDIGATIYDALGVDPHTTVRDRLGRPIPLNQGSVMNVLYG